MWVSELWKTKLLDWTTLIFECQLKQTSQTKTDGSMSLGYDLVVYYESIKREFNNIDEVNRREVCECDGWVCGVYYESIKRELNKRLIFECRCDARLKAKAEGSTRLAYTHKKKGEHKKNIKQQNLDSYREGAPAATVSLSSCPLHAAHPISSYQSRPISFH